MPDLTLEHLTTKEGLPSNDVWCITKDQQGFLWVGTGRNICRYDGYAFTTLPGLAGMTLGYCSGVSIHSRGDIYASIDTKGLCKIDQKTLRVTTLLENNFDDDNPDNDLHEQVLVDSYDQAWVSDYTSVKRYDTATKKLHQYSLSSAKNVHQYASFFEDSKRNLWVISEIGLYKYDRQRDTLFCLLGQEAINLKNRRNARLIQAFEDAAGIIWIGGYDGGLIRFSPRLEQFTFITKGFEKQNVICGQESVDENGQKFLFVGTENGISLYYPDRNEVYHLPDFYNKGIQIKNVFDDRQNGILWISSREGIYKYRYRNLGIRTINLPANEVDLPVGITSFIQLPDKNYLLGLSHSGALWWKTAQNQFHLLPYPISVYTNQLRLIRGQPFAFTDKGIFTWNSHKKRFVYWHPQDKLFTTGQYNDGFLDQKGRFWIANMVEGLKVVDFDSGRELKLWSEPVTKKMFSNNYPKAIQQGTNGRIWVATCNNGLFYFDEQRADFINILHLPANKGKSLAGSCINALQAGNDGTMLFASWGGICKVSAAGHEIVAFDHKKDKLADTYCSNICEDDQGNFWFSTNEGIHIANPKTRKIMYLTTIEGLHSNYPVGFLYTTGKELLLGYKNTINILNINKLSNYRSVPKIVISAVTVKGNDEFHDLSQEMTLQPDENALSFRFSSLNYEPASQNLYRYQLEGFDEQWVDLGSRNTVSFTNLPAQTYRLKVKSGNSFGVWSKPLVAVVLTVKPHFTGTWWFRILVGLLVGSILVGIMRGRVATIKERNRLELQMTELKLKALQSQMNPHFLFNSLNSVQNYLLTNQGLEGAKYLSKFSKLVRRIMENSNHQYLPFEQIIDTLRMYVEIESFRFNHEFDYTFEIDDDDVLLDALLPPMLLQPYVENAIWHGLMPKEGQKKLTISARTDQQHIICTIEDNGVGRAYAPRKEGHISRGQEMTNGIFESFRQKDSAASLKVIDLYDTQHNPAGTRVVMTIPIEKS